MADETGDTLDREDDIDTAVDQADEAGAEAEGTSEDAGGEDDGGDDEEIVISIGEEEIVAEADDEYVDEGGEKRRLPQWVKDLRRRDREKDRRIKELERERAAVEQPKATDLGPKPTLESCDYDSEKFEADLTAWHERKRQVDAEKDEAERAAEKQKKEWQKRLDHYAQAKAAIKAPDYADAEADVLDRFTTTQQSIVVQIADNPALLVYALGKNKAKGAELAAINDPIMFTAAIAKLETQLKMTTRAKTPPPEKGVRGNAPISGTTDTTLERLRAEAERTGDYTKVNKYKRDKRAA